MLAGRAVLDELLALAVVAAAAQLRVELSIVSALTRPTGRRPIVGRMCFSIFDDVAGAGLRSMSITSSQRSSSSLTVAPVRGLRRSSTRLSSRVMTRSASRSVSRCVSRAATVSRSQSFLPVSWSIPAYTLTRAEPLGSHAIVPRLRLRDVRGEAMAATIDPLEATKEATRPLGG